MSMEQFSPGPFQCVIDYDEDGVSCCKALSAKGVVIAEVCSDWCATGKACKQAEANARLFAASWEMLELLHEFVHTENIEDDYRAKQKALKLIARVEGREVQK